MAKIKEEKVVIKFSVLLKDDQDLNIELIDEELRKELELLAKSHIETQLALNELEINVLVEASILKDDLATPNQIEPSENTQ
jgi:hypothetical protein